uniref:Synaptobrevin, longin-like domain protein n=1 Tax=Tanacetum cinerariifolium TaxID=118510 RepID=A0A6L2LYC6_TANCI|nr:synaptobrevin, longin-like domain protein [Tanacetum cinerariifolium]
MARLQFCDYHNMVAILEKSEHNIDFHLIVDFVEASPLRYALTFKPTVYVSHIRQFWSTARIETTEEETKILATVDGIFRTVTESSLRRNLKLKDEEGISSLPDDELFKNLTLMGYNISPNQKFTFQKGQFSHQWKYLIYTIMQCLSPKSNGFNEFSTALVCLATNRVYNFSKMIFDGMVKNVNNKVSKFLMYPSPSFSGRIVPVFDTMLVPQGEGSGTPIEPHHTPSPKSSALPPVADEPASLLRDVSQGEACLTGSSLDAKQDRELEINSLKARIKMLEDKDRGVAEHSGDDALIKGRRLDVGEEAAKRVSDDTKDMSTVLTSMDAATVLSSGVVEVPTGSGSIPTTGSPATGVPTSSDVVPTAGLIFATATIVTPYTRRKGKETMVESKTPKKKKVQEQIDAQVARELEEQMAREDQRMSKQIARDAKITRIHVEEELHIMIDGLDRSNETVAKYLQEYHYFSTELPLKRRIELISDLVRYQDNYAKVHKYQTQQRKPWSKKQKRDYYMAVIKSNLSWKVKDFRGMKFEEVEAKFTTVWKQIKKFIHMGSKEEADRFKRKGIRENLNQLWILVKESLNIKPALNNEIFMLIEKDYPLRNGMAIVMICYKLQVENYSQMASDLILKIYKIANHPRQEDD